MVLSHQNYKIHKKKEMKKSAKEQRNTFMLKLACFSNLKGSFYSPKLSLVVNS